MEKKDTRRDPKDTSTSISQHLLMKSHVFAALTGGKKKKRPKNMKASGTPIPNMNKTTSHICLQLNIPVSPMSNGRTKVSNRPISIIHWLNMVNACQIQAGWWFQPTPLKNDGVKVSWDYSSQYIYIYGYGKS